MERREDRSYTQSFTLSESGRFLSVFAANVQRKGDFNPLQTLITPIFHELAPYMTKDHQILYVRDILQICIDEYYPAGHTYIENEIKIAVPAWPTNENHLIDVISHELHHITRWQVLGGKRTLGGALVREGFAVWYGIEKTGWTPPWADVAVSEDIKKKAFEEWDNSTYDHKNWFFGGTMERWVGYSLGYNLVREYLDTHFDLKKSLFTKAEEVKGVLSTLPFG